jgi:mono/diheme cytochrome c family protein/DNA-binding beta-propeller fold protein YncE
MAPATITLACAPQRPAVLAPTSTQGTSGTLALVRAGARRVALVIDEDDSALRAIDVDAGRELARVAVPGRPTSVLPLRDGRMLVTTTHPGRVVALEPTDASLGTFEERCSVPAGVEPIAMAATPDEATIAVLGRWDASLGVLDGPTLAERSRVALDRDPSSVIATADGSRMVVAHTVGSRTSSVVLATGETSTRSLSVSDERQVAVLPSGPSKRENAPIVRRTIHVQSFALVRTATAILAPGVSVDTGNGIRSFDAGYGEDIPVRGTVTALDPSTGARRFEQQRIPLGKRDCLMPRAAALFGARLYVACAGIDAVLSLDATRRDPRSAEDEGARRKVGAGPTGLAVDETTGDLFVFAALDRELSIEPAGPRPARRVIALSAASSPSPDEIALGRRIFHGEARRKLADDGRACASCHLDGRDDGLTWTTADGPRQTPLLVDRLDRAAPFGWNGVMPTLDAHLRQTVSRLRGTGLDEHERRALIAYLGTLHAPANASIPANASVPADAARGEAIFAREDVGCASCHPGGTTDGLGHDVGGRTRGDRVFAIDTPSLRHVARSAPYFHDGRFATLEELLAHTDGAMGTTRALSDDDRAALISYLRAL